MKETILQAIFDFSKDEDGDLQNINKHAFGFLADHITEQVGNVAKPDACDQLSEVMTKIRERSLFSDSSTIEIDDSVLEEILSHYFG